MTTTPYPSALLNDLLSVGNKPITTLSTLHQAIQGAITFAFAAVPVALNALYAISPDDKKNTVFLAGLVQDRLQRACLLANLLVAVGGVPKFSGVHTPRYPCRDLAGDGAIQPLFDLSGAPDGCLAALNISQEQQSVMVLPGQGQAVGSIGQLYKWIEDGLVQLEENAQFQGESIFAASRGYRQLDDVVFMPARVSLEHINNLMDAHLLLRGLVGQCSEKGTLKACSSELAPTLASSTEGQELDRREATDPALVAKLSALFNNCYALWLRSLEHCFEESTEGADNHATVVSTLIGEVFPHLAMVLQALSADTAPEWLYQPSSLEQICSSNRLLLDALRADSSADYSKQVAALNVVAEQCDHLRAMA